MHANSRHLTFLSILWILPTTRAFHTHHVRGSAHVRYVKNTLSLQPRSTCNPTRKAILLSSYPNGDGIEVIDTNRTEAFITIELQDDESADSNRIRIVPEMTLPTRQLPDSTATTVSPILQFRTTYRDLLKAAVIGLASGVAISMFKLAVESVQHFFYNHPAWVAKASYRALVPVMGGLLVGCLSLPGTLPPGMIDVLTEVDRESKLPVRPVRTRVRQQIHSVRKSAAAALTLGTGCSLGPEGPCVELGMSVARSCMDLQAKGSRSDRLAWNRMLLSCGAASGVAAGFNAPLSGILFAMEVIGNAFRKSEKDDAFKENNDSMLSAPSTIVPVVVSSVLAVLITQRLVGTHKVLQLSHYALRNILAEIPLYAMLGTLSGFVAFEFNQFSKLSKEVFQGTRGSAFMKSFMKRTPASLKPMMGGLFCGSLGLLVPGILFVGYDSINALLGHGAMSTARLLMLLLAKGIATAISGGSGLVGGTFAPSLFLGAMTGASFHNVVSRIFAIFARSTGLLSSFSMSDLPGYTLVGAASVLAALFRAPLTATMLLFELTHDYKVLLPLMVSAGIGSVVRDVLEAKACARMYKALSLEHR